MSRTRSRLRKLEAAASGPRKVRIVWSNTSDKREWNQQIAEMIDSGRARADDTFMRVGWLPPVAPDSTIDADRRQAKEGDSARLAFLNPKIACRIRR
jgi:hypothetical protein